MISGRARRWKSETDKLATDRSQRIIYGITIGKSAYSFLRGQLGWLREAGWTVELVCSDDPAAVRAAERERVELHTIRMTRRVSPIIDAISLVSWIREIARFKPDALNVSTPKAGLLGGLAGWFLRVPRRVYVVRGLRVEGATGFMAAILWIMERVSMAVATDVIFVSRSLAMEAYSRKLVGKGRSWLVGAGSSNGVDATGVAARVSEVDRVSLRKSLVLDADCFLVGFIGRVTADKGIDSLIDVFMDCSLTANTRLLVLGTFEGSGIEARLRLLGQRVRFVPWTDDVWGYLPAIDVLCLPTHREGFPNVVLEAAAAGIPAITTDATGAVDSVVDGETGYLVGVDDVKSMVERINRLSSKPELLETMGAKAKRRAETDFEPVRVWEGIHDVLSGVETSTRAERLHVTSVGNRL